MSVHVSKSLQVVRPHAGASAVVKLPRCGGVLEARGNLSGVVSDPHGTPQFSLSGSFASTIMAHDLSPSASPADQEGKHIFDVAPLPVDAELQYSMTAIAITLNAPVPGEDMVSCLDSADSAPVHAHPVIALLVIVDRNLFCTLARNCAGTLLKHWSLHANGRHANCSESGTAALCKPRLKGNQADDTDWSGGA